MTKKVALITGVTGQDGSYLAEFLLEKGYKVHGIKRRSSSFNTGRIDHLVDTPDFKLHYGDMTDGLSITKIINNIKPDEIYNLAAQSHVKVSFEHPAYTAQVDAMGTLHVLEAIKLLGIKPKFYQASTSELYGKVRETPQTETTPFYPISPYGVAKMYSYWITKTYREAYDIFACNGILFNHESPRRGETFVTRKITRAVGAIKRGEQKVLELGNINALRDWGHAKDYVRGMWLILQQPKPSDIILATGEQHSVREFCELAFERLGMPIAWEGEGVDEKGLHKGKVVVSINPEYYRPTELETLLGDPSKAEALGWKRYYTFNQLVNEMVDYDS